MSNSKIEIKVGSFTFSGEGDPKWLSEQMDKILAKANDLINLAPPVAQVTPTTSSTTSQITPKAKLGNISLAKFLSDHSATKNQVKKFLGAVVWLTEVKGMSRLSTGDVTKALAEASQTRLGNASDSLKKNVAKGNIQKDGKQFYVTVHGKEEFGLK